jgi:hypothetical protein
MFSSEIKNRCIVFPLLAGHLPEAPISWHCLPLPRILTTGLIDARTLVLSAA